MAKLTYTDETADQICEHIALGKSLVSWCKADETRPSYTTVMNWLKASPKFLENYTCAREAQADYIAEEIQDIADEIGKDVQHQRLRVDTRKWIASKMKPKKYGDSTTIKGDKDAPLTQTVIVTQKILDAMTIEQLEAVKDNSLNVE